MSVCVWGGGGGGGGGGCDGGVVACIIWLSIPFYGQRRSCLEQQQCKACKLVVLSSWQCFFFYSVFVSVPLN